MSIVDVADMVAVLTNLAHKEALVSLRLLGGGEVVGNVLSLAAGPDGFFVKLDIVDPSYPAATCHGVARVDCVAAVVVLAEHE